MKRIFAGFVFIAASCAALAQRDDRHKEFDSLLERRAYDQLLFRLAPERFGKGVGLTSEQLTGDVAWLRSRADEGHVPLLYVLAFRSVNLDPSESLHWYARARTFGLLDGAECIANRFPWSAVLEMSFPELGRLRTQNQRVYWGAADEALKFDQARASRPSAAWYCDGGVLPEPQRAIKRQERFKSLLDSNNKRLSTGKED